MSVQAMNIGAAGALFAAWLAFDAIQEQLSEERERRNREQAEAKEAAVVCIAPTIHAASSALLVIDRALQATKAVEAETDALVALAATHV
jgi:small neutral amino acid transporter SnatA (MarC family)